VSLDEKSNDYIAGHCCDIICMLEVFTIRILKELRERMRHYQVNWSQEIREFIEKGEAA